MQSFIRCTSDDERRIKVTFNRKVIPIALPHVSTVMVNEERKEIIYLTMYSTHFIYGCMASDILRNHSDSERGNPLPPLHRLHFPISNTFYMHHHTDKIGHTTAFVAPIVDRVYICSETEFLLFYLIFE